MDRDDERALDDARYATAGRLVRGAVHDIKNPAGFVSGNLTYMRQSGGEIARRIHALRDHLGPYAEPGELREAVLHLLEAVDREGPELEACLDECDTGLRQLVGYSRALSRVANETPTVERVGLDELVNEALESARLYGRHIARFELDLPPRTLELPRRPASTLLTALLLDVLESCGRRGTGHTVRVRYEGGLCIEDDGPERPLPATAVLLAAPLELELSRERMGSLTLTRVSGL